MIRDVNGGVQMNKWHIPESLENEVRARDIHCVYCGVRMIEKALKGASRKTVATWEHIINDESIVTHENIALCCTSCNASKGARELSEWIHSSYCKKRRISEDTVAEIIKKMLRTKKL